MYFFPLHYTFFHEIEEFESEVHKNAGKGAFFWRALDISFFVSPTSSWI